MKQKKNFEMHVLLMQSVQPEDEAFGVSKDAAISFGDFKYRVFPRYEKAVDGLTINQFYDPVEDRRYVLSKNELLGKRFIGEKVVGMFLAESRLTSQVINVRVTVVITKQPQNGGARAEVILNNEIDVPTLKAGETIVCPFLLSLEPFNYE